MIKFEQVSKVFPGGFKALNNISFNIEKGEMIFVAGHSGAGKTTLLRLVSGIIKPTPVLVTTPMMMPAAAQAMSTPKTPLAPFSSPWMI